MADADTLRSSDKEVLKEKSESVENEDTNSNKSNSIYVENGKNRLNLICVHCPSKIMTPGTGEFIREEKDLPKMNQKKNCCEVEVDQISEWFVVDDVFLFENIGVSHSVGEVKYLSCADCEMGPVGWNDMVTKKCYVALSRVRQS